MHTPRRHHHITHPDTNNDTHIQHNNITPPALDPPPTPPTPTQNINSGYTSLPLPALQPTEIRVLSHNINTLPTSSPAELGVSFDLYANLNPSIIGLQETNKNWTKYDATVGRVKHCIDRRWPGAKLITSHCHDTSFRDPSQPGGVAQMILRQLTARVTAHGKDELGRYAWQEILLDGHRTLLVITAYRVAQRHTTGCGPTTSIMQQWRKLREQGIANPNPKQQLLDDLTDFLSPHVAAHNEILIMLDANDPIASTALDTFMDEMNLCDLMSDFLPTRPPTTYQRGRNKIDHIIGTMGIHLSVTRAYVIPFGEDTPRSDHAICGVDFSLDLLSGISPESLYDPTHPSSRQLWSTDIKAAESYITLVEQRFEHENIEGRIHTLLHRCQVTGQCSPDDIRILNEIDGTITSIMLWAENKCKRPKGPHEWSPLLANAGRTVIAAKWALSNLMNGRTPIPHDITREQAIGTARRQIQEAYGALRKVQRRAKLLRETFLEDRAEHLEATRNITKADALRQLVAAERSSSIFKRLGIWFKGNEFTTLDRMLVPDSPHDLLNTTWTSVIEAQALFEVLTSDCEKHFQQAATTPFVTGPIADRIGPFEDNEYCDAVLNGTFDFDGIADITEINDFIKGMRYPDPNHPTPLIDATIDDESLISAIAHTRERTSSSPSGRHYGHYRTLLRSPLILGLIASLADFCFRWGVTMTRWNKVIQPQLPKDNGTPRLNRIRRITLIEADLNISLSILFGRRMMDNAESHQLLHPHQYGSRKGRMSISAVLLKRLSYDIARQTRMDAIMFDNDATACYDRIIPSQAAMLSRRAGMPRNAAYTFIQVLLLMEYFVRTAYGVASTGYSNATNWLLGVMQGAGHSGALWALESSVMLDQMESADGATFHSPYPTRPSCQRNGEAFVDDASLWALRLGIMFSQLVHMMCMTAQRWERLLFVTGGALNLLKCYWYGMHWTFNDSGGPILSKIQDDDLKIALSSGVDFETKYEIQRVEVTKGMRTLGVRLAPDGNDHDEFTYRLDESTKMRDRLKRAPLVRSHVGIGFRAIWKMKLQYPIGATCFTKKQCNKIQSRYMPTFLSKMGINRTTNTAVRHGPLSLGGMDIFHLETEQCVQHVKLLISHIRKGDDIGRMMMTSIDHLQLQAGTSWPVLSQSGRQVRNYVDQCYATHTWEFLDGIDSYIQLEPSTWMSPQRTGDRFIMEDVARIPGIKKIELVHVQRVRLFLGVTTLADISNSAGTALCAWAINVDPNPRPSTLCFPRQARPRSALVLATWRRLIRLCYSPHSPQTLEQPLGPWHKGRVRQTWSTAIDTATGKVHVLQNNRVHLYARRSRSEYRYERPTTHCAFPITCVPISGTLRSGVFTTNGYAPMTRTGLPPLPHLHLDQHMNRGVMIRSNRATIAKAFWDGQAIMGTDGSVKGSSATYSFVISLSKTSVTECVKGGGLLPPSPQYMDHYSKRAEAAALLSGLRWVQQLLRQFPNHNDTLPSALSIPIDNDSVVRDVYRTLRDQTPTFDYLSTDYDIMQAVRQTICELPIDVSIYHVKSHQDLDKHWSDLDPSAQVNVLADRHADSLYRRPPGRIGLFPQWVPGTRASLFHRDRQVTKTIPDYIREAKHAPAMRSYLIRRSQEARGRDKKWDETTYESIDWKHFGESFRKLSIGRRIQISKFTNDLLPTRRRLQTIDNRIDGRCFACQHLWEDTTHVLTCSCDPRATARSAARTVFQRKLSRLHTPDVMTKLLCTSMDSWLERRPVLAPIWDGPSDLIQRQLRRAFHAQSRIGWDQFFRGRIAKDWSTPIATYYKMRQPGSSFTPDNWMRTVISELWTFSITLWKNRNTEYHGTDGAISLEHRRRETATAAEEVYHSTIGSVLPSDSIILHQQSIATILQWNQEHLDAYLQSAEIILAQRDEATG